MTTTINAQATNGLLTTADGSGILKVQSNGVATNSLVWCNYAGGSTTTRSSYNVSSMTKSSAGLYYVTTSVALSDANYTVFLTGSVDTGPNHWMIGMAHGKTSSPYYTAPTTSVFYAFYNYADGATGLDPVYANIVVFGN